MDTKVVITVRADLYLEGAPEAQFTAVVSEGDTFRMKEENGIFYVRADSDIKIRLPETASVTIEKVDGDANVHDLKSRVIVGKIGGDFNLQGTAGASIESVGSDCALREVSGMVEIARVGGDLVIEQSAQTLVGNVGGDLEVASVSGKFDSKVGGDVELKLTDPAIAPIRIFAGGDIQVVVPGDANARLVLLAGGEITIDTRDNQAEFERVARDIILGQGGNTLELKAGGDIAISDKEILHFHFNKVFNAFDQDWEKFSDNIEQKIAEGMKRAFQSTENATLQAEKASRKAQDKVVEVMQRLEKKGIFNDRGDKFTGFSFERPAEPQAPEKPKVSENERMIILKMLAEKKITIEEAENLLKALEG